MHGVDALFGGKAGVRSAALNEQFGFANSFTRGLQQPARTEGRLEDKDGIAAARFGLDELARGFAADFFVRGPQEDDLFLQPKLGLP